MSDEPPKEDSQTSQSKKLVNLGRATFEESIPGPLKPAYKLLVSEAKGMQQGWVLCLIVACLFAYSGYKLSKYRFDKRFSDASNSFSISNSYSQGIITGLKEQVKDSQRRIDDFKRDADAQTVNLKIDLNEAKRERDSALQRVAELEVLPASAAIIYSNILSLTNALSSKDTRYRALPNGMVADGAIAQGNPTNSVNEIREALQYFNANDHAKAYDHAKAAIEMENTSLKGIVMSTGGLNTDGKHLMYYIGAVSAMTLQRKEEAREWSEKAAKLKKRDDLSQILYITSLANLGLTSDAQVALDKAIKVSTNKSAYAELVQAIGSPSTVTNK